MAFYALKVIPVVLVLLCTVQEIFGHGMLMDPVNRGSMWRKGYSTPINYDDNANYCGGYSVMWNQNGGQCGLCGDDYAASRPRPNENMGTYGTGISVATYSAGSFINVTVRITANHKGYFNFSVCPLESGELETESCFQAYPLYLADGSTTYTLPSTDTGDYVITVKLPNALTCKQCSLRWQYVAGNNWGTCEDGTSATGCGPQEIFRTCSDITIA